MSSILIRAFESHPMFEGISARDCASLMHCLGCTEKTYKKDQIISTSAAPSNEVGIVISGYVHTIDEDIWGRSTFLQYTGPDGIFGEMQASGFTEEKIVTFKAAEPTTVLFLPVERILHPCKNSCPFHHKLSRNLFNLISRKNVALMEKIGILSKSTLREKILAYLSMEAQKNGSMTITLPLNRMEMADYLCTNRSALSRELANMKKDGILDYDQRVFYLHSTPSPH